jgi:ATP-binding cassette, subfamily F, member 3
VQITGLAKSYGARTLFEGVSFRLDPGERLAVVGRNGTGKTTLLRCLAGQVAPDAGEVVLPRGARLALHDQRPPLGRELTLGEYVAEGLAGHSDIERRLAELEARMAAGDHGPEVMRAYERAHAELDHAGGYAWRSWLERVLRGLGIGEGELDRPLASFSGGELTRASLARALVSRPDVLLLDEPTNHLDLPSMEWLEEALSDVGAAIVLVSHDRWFLESVASAVLDLEGRPRVWPMRYSAFRRAKAEALAQQATQAERQEQEIAHLERFVARWRAGTRSRQAQSRLKRLERIERVEAPTRARALEFGFPRAERPGRVVIEAHDLEVRAGERTLVSGASFAVERGQRVAVVGPNGAGKTSLVETLVGRRRAHHGRVAIGHRVAIGYFSQHAQELRGDRTVLETVLAGSSLTQTQARTLLGRFLFPGEVADRRVEVLSGGERRRLALVALIARGGNLLMLDEPTNHLDVESREALEDALLAYDGTVVFVSHDRALIDLVATHTLALEDGAVRMRAGGYSDLVRAREAAAAPPPPPAPGRRPARTAAQDGGGRPKAASRRRVSELARIEGRIGALEEGLREVEAELSDPAAAADRGRVTALGDRHRELQTELAWLMAEWERAAEAAEARR